MSHDAVLVEAFRNGEDIHTRTAAEVMGIPPLMVGPEDRRRAKAVNFGIVYGQPCSVFRSNWASRAAKPTLYIRSYFERYVGVKSLSRARLPRSGVPE
jgi:DNA polymerase-1